MLGKPQGLAKRYGTVPVEGEKQRGCLHSQRQSAQEAERQVRLKAAAEFEQSKSFGAKHEMSEAPWLLSAELFGRRGQAVSTPEPSLSTRPFKQYPYQPVVAEPK